MAFLLQAISGSRLKRKDCIRNALYSTCPSIFIKNNMVRVLVLVHLNELENSRVFTYKVQMPASDNQITSSSSSKFNATNLKKHLIKPQQFHHPFSDLRSVFTISRNWRLVVNTQASSFSRSHLFSTICFSMFHQQCSMFSMFHQ